MLVELDDCDVAVILSALNDGIREIKNDPAFVRDLKVAYRKVAGARSVDEPVLTGGEGEDLEF